MTSSAIRFYKPKEAYYEFSNFYPAQFELDGKTWSTSEHYFQANKFLPDFPEYAELIRQCSTPGKAFNLARQKGTNGYGAKWMIDPKHNKTLVNEAILKYKDIVKLRSDWYTAKVQVMKKALLAKFSQNPKLKELLLSTGDTQIIEDSPRDSYWGVGKNGDGENQLGKLLMEVRAELRNTAGL